MKGNKMDAMELKRIDNLLKEVAGGLPYELAKEELQVICDTPAGEYYCDNEIEGDYEIDKELGEHAPDKDHIDTEAEVVDVIASGYEWLCPRCSKWNKIIEFPHNAKTHCQKCGYYVELDIPDHAME